MTMRSLKRKPDHDNIFQAIERLVGDFPVLLCFCVSEGNDHCFVRGEGQPRNQIRQSYSLNAKET